MKRTIRTSPGTSPSSFVPVAAFLEDVLTVLLVPFIRFRVQCVRLGETGEQIVRASVLCS